MPLYRPLPLEEGGTNAANAPDALTSLGAEASANKSTNVVTDGASDTKYPSVKSVKDYADGLVVGLLDYRGAYDASGNAYPTTGGSGAAGAIMKGDTWVISVQGTLGGATVHVGDSIIANVDTPDQDSSKWNTLNSNLSYVPEDSANKENSTIDTSTTKYPTVNLLKTGLDTKLNNTVAALGDLIAGATGKATPVSADLFAVSDSADSGDVKKLTFAELIAALKPYLMDYTHSTVSKQHTGVGGGGAETQLFQVTGQVEVYLISAKVTVATNSTSFSDVGWRFIDTVGNTNDITKTSGVGPSMSGTGADAGLYKLGLTTAAATHWNAGNARTIDAASVPPLILQKEVGRDCFIAFKWTGNASTDVTMEHAVLWRPLSSDGNVVAV